MTAVRRVWCPQDARDARLAARAVHAKRLVVGGDEHGIWLKGVIEEPMPVSQIPGRTRGRHRRRNRLSLLVDDIRRTL